MVVEALSLRGEQRGEKKGLELLSTGVLTSVKATDKLVCFPWFFHVVAHIMFYHVRDKVTWMLRGFASPLPYYLFVEEALYVVRWSFQWVVAKVHKRRSLDP